MILLHTKEKYFFEDNPESVIEKLQKECAIDAVFTNRDYTPFSKRRDALLAKTCKNLHIAFEQYCDLLLHEPEQVHNTNNLPYKIFTPFHKMAQNLPVKQPKKMSYQNFFIDAISFACSIISSHDIKISLTDTLDHIKELHDYTTLRDFPSLNGTTHLSSHIKFGSISIRQLYYFICENLGENHPLLRQLYWRDFFHHIAYHFPHVFGNAFYLHYNNILWDNNEDFFEKWKNGITGFPIVDAGMRELKTTGYMHNRVRMIVASFLVKDLHIDWKKGEKYFATQLEDYDPCINNGNWQWAASTGCDAQPYFRIFNPWRQQERFDNECIYIKKWVTELKDLSAKDIHTLYKKDNSFFDTLNYPKPIVDHDVASKKAKEMFAFCVNNQF